MTIPLAQPPELVAPAAAVSAPVDRVASIDGLRAVAMTMVVAGHCYLIPIGWTGVWLFYVISGHVIMRGFLQRGSALIAPGEAYRSFLARRFWRIAPIYALYVVVACLAGWAVDTPSVIADAVPSLASFTFNWYLIDSMRDGTVVWFPLRHLWSLSVEQQFYLLFPIVVLWVRPAHREVALAALAVAALVSRIVASMLVAAVGGTELWQAFTVYMSSPGHFDAFAAGAWLALERSRRSRPCADPLARWLVGLGIAYVLFYAGLGVMRSGWSIGALQGVVWGPIYGEGREVLLYPLVAGIGMLVLRAAIDGAAGLQWLAHPVLVWVGRVSYGGYLFHVLWIWALARLVGADPEQLNAIPFAQRVALFIAVMIGTLAVAGVSFHAFEEPIRCAAMRAAKRRPR